MTRLPQKEEHFSAKHYQSHIAPLLQAEVRETDGKIEKPPIHAIKRVMREAYANAPEHMRREVEDELAEMKRLKEETRQKDRDAKDGETEIERTAGEYAV